MVSIPLLRYTLSDMPQGVVLFLGIFVILLLAAFFVFLIYYHGMTTAVFSFCFKKNTEDKWKRGCSDPSNEMIYRMNEVGNAWYEDHAHEKEELEVYNDKLRLAATYFNLGHDNSVILIPPMYETSVYSYYYADTYAKAGFNVLCIDNRATGNSGGEYNSLGFYESGDVLAWAKLLNSKYGVTGVLLAGIQTGAVTALLALNDGSCPAYVTAAVCDSIYPDFAAFFKKFMIKKRYNTLVHKAVLRKIQRYIGPDASSVSPVYFIEDISSPVLFINGENDSLVDEDEIKELFDACGKAKRNEAKKLIFLEEGEGGTLKLCNSLEYDKAVAEFTGRYF